MENLMKLKDILSYAGMNWVVLFLIEDVLQASKWKGAPILGVLFLVQAVSLRSGFQIFNVFLRW